MKKVALAAAITAVAASSAFAGSYVEPIIEPEIVVEEAAGTSNAGLIVPLLLIAIVAAAVASD